MAKGKQIQDRPYSITVGLKDSGYKHIKIFNRFNLNILDDFTIVQCALVNDENQVVDIYGFSIFKDDIKKNSNSILGHIGQVETMSEPKKLNFQPMSPYLDIDNIQIINSCYADNVAEIRLDSFAMHHAINLDKTNKQGIIAMPIALLRSSIELNRILLMTLFSNI